MVRPLRHGPVQPRGRPGLQGPGRPLGVGEFPAAGGRRKPALGRRRTRGLDHDALDAALQLCRLRASGVRVCRRARRRKKVRAARQQARRGLRQGGARNPRQRHRPGTGARALRAPLRVGRGPPRARGPGRPRGRGRRLRQRRGRHRHRAHGALRRGRLSHRPEPRLGGAPVRGRRRAPAGADRRSAGGRLLPRSQQGTRQGSQAARTPAEARAVSPQLSALLALRHAADLLPGAGLVPQDHGLCRQDDRGERADPLVAAGDRQRAHGGVAGQPRGLGAVARSVLGHAAAGVGVRARRRSRAAGGSVRGLRRLLRAVAGARRRLAGGFRSASSRRGPDHLPVRRAGLPRRDAPRAAGHRLLVRQRRDALRAAPLALRERGPGARAVPGGLHCRGRGPDARLVLHLACDRGLPHERGHDAPGRARPARGRGLQVLLGRRLAARRQGAEDVEAPRQHRPAGRSHRAPRGGRDPLEPAGRRSRASVAALRRRRHRGRAPARARHPRGLLGLLRPLCAHRRLVRAGRRRRARVGGAPGARPLDPGAGGARRRRGAGRLRGPGGRPCPGGRSRGVR